MDAKYILLGKEKFIDNQDSGESKKYIEILAEADSLTAIYSLYIRANGDVLISTVPTIYKLTNTCEVIEKI